MPLSALVNLVGSGQCFAATMANIPCTHRVTRAEIAASRESVRELSRRVGAAMKEAGAEAMLVAWLSDFHLFAPRDYGAEDLGEYAQFRDPRAIVRFALEEVHALRPAPDLLIYGGDLINSGLHGDGHDDEFEVLKQILDAHAPKRIPSLFVPGNHDHGDYPLSAAFHREFARWRRDGWPSPVETDDFYYAVIRNGWRFIILDTRHSQPLTRRQRTWLSRQLDDASLPTAILLHRPFFKCGNIVDPFRFIDPDTFALLSNSPAVRVIVAGHTHKAVAWKFRKQVHIIFPGLAYGIDDAQGWGCLILHPRRPPQIFAKALAVQFDGPLQRRKRPVPNVRRVKPRSYRELAGC